MLTAAKAKAPAIRLVALDLDGTLIDPGNRILEEVRDALGAAARKGILLSIVTGRPHRDAKGLLESGQIRPQNGYPHALIVEEREIYLMRQGRYEPLREWNDAVTARCDAMLATAQQLLSEALAWCDGRGLRYKRCAREVEAERKVALASFERVEDAEAALNWLQAETARRGPGLRAGRNQRIVGVCSDMMGKGTALRRLAEHLGIEPAAVLAVGDSRNDEDMLDGTNGFQAATTSNAEEVIKAIVHHRGGYVASLPFGRGVLEILKAAGCL
jgi:HAD superfamily hydrolase (TIGR01484 family)